MYHRCLVSLVLPFSDPCVHKNHWLGAACGTCSPRSVRGSGAEAGGEGRTGEIIFVFPCSRFPLWLMQTHTSKWHKCGPLITCAVFESSEKCSGRYRMNPPGSWAPQRCLQEEATGCRRVLYQPLKFQQLSMSLFDFYFLFSLPSPTNPSCPQLQHCSSSGKGSLVKQSAEAPETERYKRGIELSGFFGRDCLSSRLKPAKCSLLFYTLAEAAFYTPLAIFVLDL